MKDVSAQNFGYLIAFVLPGFVALHALAQADPSLAVWLDSISAGDPRTVGGFLYVTLASVAAGLAVSTVRWLFVDAIHHHTGVPPPTWNDARLQDNLAAFEALVAAHYRFYQHYANTFVALLAVLATRLVRTSETAQCRPTAMLCLLLGLYWLGSRDTLRRYYRRAECVLGQPEQERNRDKWTSSQKDKARPHAEGRPTSRSPRRRKREQAR